MLDSTKYKEKELGFIFFLHFLKIQRWMTNFMEAYLSMPEIIGYDVGFWSLKNEKTSVIEKRLGELILLRFRWVNFWKLNTFSREKKNNLIFCFFDF